MMMICFWLSPSLASSARCLSDSAHFTGISAWHPQQVNRETGQMHGLISMIEGEFTALFLSVLPSPDPSGLGLSHLLRESASVAAGKQKPWNFHHTDERGRVVQQGGLVVGRPHLDPATTAIMGVRLSDGDCVLRASRDM